MFVDMGNYNNSVPLVLLMLEYCFNNIQFYWTHFSLVCILNYIYMAFLCCYCVLTKKEPYEGLNLNDELFQSSMKMMTCNYIAMAFFVGFKKGNEFKYWANGLSRKIEII